MSNAFDLSIRVLTCDNCGAPLEVPTSGGEVSCRYCRAVVLVTARPVIPEAETRDTTSDESARLGRLRAQAGQPIQPPARVAKLCTGLVLRESELALALSLFLEARRQATRGDAPEAERELYYLAILLSNYYQSQNDYLRLRAFLESALEAARTAPTRQMLCATLARTAARLGELDAARDWLEKCDPRSEDLLADSDYRASRAFLSILRGDFADVIATLGEKGDDIPISTDSDAVCALYRAHALEMSRSPEAGAAELVRMAEASSVNWFVMAKSRANNQKTGLALCPASFELARRELSWSRTSPFGVPLGCAGVLAFVLGLLALFEVGYPALAIVAVLGLVPVGLLTRKWMALARDVE